MRACKVCHQTKDTSDFRRNRRTCCDCQRESDRQRYAANAAERRAYRRKYYYANRDKQLEYQRQYKLTHPNDPVVRRLRTLRDHGLSPKEYARILANQNGVCALCFGGPGRREFAIDHDHETGVVRGLLCDPCNRGLGLLRDDWELLHRAAEYVLESKKFYMRQVVY